MAFPLFHYNSDQEPGEPEPPFTLWIEHRDQMRDGHWRPAASILLTPALRTSGFLLSLPPEELQSFLLLLTFLTADGRIAPVTPQLAQALEMSTAKTRARLDRLLKTRWLGQPVVTKNEFGSGAFSGEFSYSPATGLITFREDEGQIEPPRTVAPYRAAGSEAIIAHSRQTYARPRAEVEREIEQFYHQSSSPPQLKPPSKRRARSGPSGQTSPAHAASAHTSRTHSSPTPTSSISNPSQPAMTYLFSSPQETAYDEATLQLRKALIGAGVYPEQADELLVEYDQERIRRQLLWLPYRGARNSAGFLIAAIHRDYEAPISLKHQAATIESSPQEDKAAETEAEAAVIDTTVFSVPNAE